MSRTWVQDLELRVYDLGFRLWRFENYLVEGVFEDVGNQRDPSDHRKDRETHIPGTDNKENAHQRGPGDDVSVDARCVVEFMIKTMRHHAHVFLDALCTHMTN
jgi:hypothetical protein